MNSTSNQENQYLLLKNIPESKLKAILDLYGDYQKIYLYVRFVIFGVLGTVLIYNLGFAGNNYSISDFNTIKTTMVIIMMCFVGLLIVIGIKAYKKQKIVKTALKKASIEHNIEFKPLKKEFNRLVRTSFKGPKI
ncbi:hypothetical protein [Aquimarina celericrescens]|uniref:DUF4231 domain-containing protein n=1 Tax=Aquimarina celericrescens TaxID=1964542 RepID=A0ABW5ATT4_9FLAO|nr:hypothetical protein [Aquimarina celericrescens]